MGDHDQDARDAANTIMAAEMLLDEAKEEGRVTSMRKTIPLRKGDKANFQTILEAAENGDLALVSAVRKADDADVALVCAMGHDEQHSYPIPIAVMVEGSPFTTYHDPAGAGAYPHAPDEIADDRILRGKPVSSQNARKAALSSLADLAADQGVHPGNDDDFRSAMSELAQELEKRAEVVDKD